jgi:hypothetical protein
MIPGPAKGRATPGIVSSGTGRLFFWGRCRGRCRRRDFDGGQGDRESGRRSSRRFGGLTLLLITQAALTVVLA